MRIACPFSISKMALAAPSVDPAQPPLEPAWAEVAAAALDVACRLDPALEAIAFDMRSELGAEDLRCVAVGPLWELQLEQWPEDREANNVKTGGLIWRGGEYLAGMLSSLEGLAGQRVLDLGSGTGVAGLAAAVCGADVVLADLPPNVPLLERNILRNRGIIEKGGGVATATDVDWSDEGCFAKLGSCNLVLCADAVWHEDQCEPLSKWLANFGAPCLFLCLPRGRDRQVQSALQDAWVRLGLEVLPLKVESPLHACLLGRIGSESALGRSLAKMAVVCPRP